MESLAGDIKVALKLVMEMPSEAVVFRLSYNPEPRIHTIFRSKRAHQEIPHIYTSDTARHIVKRAGHAST